MKICKLNECPFDLPHYYQSNTHFLFPFSFSPDLSSHPPPKLSNAHFCFLSLSPKSFKSFAKKYLFVTALLPPNADAHFLCFCSGSERGSYAIFGFEAFFSARHRSRSTRPVEERHVLRSSRTLFLSSVHPNGLRFPWTLGTLFPGDIQTRTRTSPSPSPSPPWNIVPW